MTPAPLLYKFAVVSVPKFKPLAAVVGVPLPMVNNETGAVVPMPTLPAVLNATFFVVLGVNKNVPPESTLKSQSTTAGYVNLTLLVVPDVVIVPPVVIACAPKLPPTSSL
jgi:hypothetical protein